MTDADMLTKATKAARAMVRRRPHGDDRYGLDDMIQDGCLAELRGRSAWYGVIDGLRHWLGRNGRIETMPLNDRIDAPYYPDPLREMITRERLDWHLARLDKLDPQRRCAYMLRRHEGKHFKEIAKILNRHPQRIVKFVMDAEKFVT
jgi:DNA-directed RNA polymerase specialized sigma24 family protein